MATITGTPDADLLNGTSDRDLIEGLEGNDTLAGRARGDTLDGGAGDDSVDGGIGHDVLVYRWAENTGADVYRGGEGRDVLRLELTAAEWVSADVQGQIAQLQGWLDAAARGVDGTLLDPTAGLTLKLGGRMLELSGVDRLQVFVDGTRQYPSRPAFVGGDLTGAVTEDASASTLTDRGSFRFHDANLGQSHTATVRPLDARLGGTLNAVISDRAEADGQGEVSWTYTLDNALAQGMTAADAATQTFQVVVTDDAGQTLRRTVSVTVAGVDDVASIGGAVRGVVVEDAMLTTGGRLTITDADAGQAAFQPVAAGTQGANGYGTFSLTGAGAWTYRLDNAHPDVQALNDGETLTDSQVVTSLDGSASVTLNVTIEGESERLVIDLVNADADDGFRISPDVGPYGQGRNFGFSIASAGDLNGDGFDDVVIGQEYSSTTSAEGASFVVFGKGGPFGEGAGSGLPVVDTEVLTADDGFVVRHTHGAVSAAGDVNGDGLDDLLVGGADPSAAAYILFGSRGRVGAVDDAGRQTVDPRQLFGAQGVVIEVSVGAWIGRRVAAAGDVNGDGFDDVMVGASPVDNFERDREAFVVFGAPGGPGSDDPTGRRVVGLDDLSPTEGLVVVGDPLHGHVGIRLSSAGDINGDGLDDMVFASSYVDDRPDLTGEAYVIFGAVSERPPTDAAGRAVLDITRLLPDEGFIVRTSRAAGYGGPRVAHAGDMNGDGFDDLIIGTYRATMPHVYVVFGSGGGFGAPDAAGRHVVDLVGLPAGLGFVIAGDPESPLTGRSIASAGDVNGDGLDDLIVTAERRFGEYDTAGEAYVVFGSGDPIGQVDATGRQVLDLARLSAAQGFVIEGPRRWYADFIASSAGDVNGDGFDDLVISDFGPGDDHVGEAYVVFGARFGAGGDPITLVGTAAAEVLLGGAGDDALSGGGGADVIRAGAGDDRLAVSDMAFKRVDGGRGRDTLSLIGAGTTLDLTHLLPTVITDVEVVDLSAPGDQVLRMSALDVLGMSTERVDGRAVLRVTGGSGDRVDLLGPGWGYAGEAADGADVFVRLSNGLAELQIQRGVAESSGAIDVATIGGTATGLVFEDGSADAGGSLTVADVDAGEEALRPIAAGTPGAEGYGSFEVSADGAWHYTLANDSAAVQAVGGDTRVVDTIVVTSLDGSAQGTIRVTIVGANDDATLEGERVGQVVEDTTFEARGMLVVRDIDHGEARLQPYSGAGERGHGRFEVDAAGGWTYVLANGSAAVQALEAGQTLEDSLVVSSHDGTASQTLSITITGVADGVERVIDLGSLRPAAGYVVQGQEVNGGFGASVATAGDLDGDGLDEVIAAQSWGGTVVVVVQGARGGVGTVDGNGRAVVDAEDPRVGEGYNLELLRPSGGVASAGDLNGDGLDDLVVGSSAGAWVLFGSAVGTGAQRIDVGKTLAADGFLVTGRSFEVGSVASAGDVNGDGFDDLFVGVPNGDLGGVDAGGAYVVFGSGIGFGVVDAAGRAVVDVTRLTAAEGFVIQGDEAGNRAGSRVASAGDVNGDGFDDLIIAAGYGSGWSDDFPGESYVVFGSDRGFGQADAAGRRMLDLTGLPATAGFIIRGQGVDVASAGDVNGDGLDDMIVGTLYGTVRGAYVVFGSLEGFGTPDEYGRCVLDTATLTADDGFVLRGATNAAVGHRVAAAGDVNGDGFYDVIVGLGFEHGDRNPEGVAHVVFGRASGFGNVDAAGREVLLLADLLVGDAVRGLVIVGDAPNDGAGSSVASAGDTNGDGYGDVIVGAIGGDDAAPNAGEAYVVFGAAFGSPVTPLTVTGSANGEMLVGGAGDDTLAGGGGADVLRAGAGDDRLEITDATFRQLDGGTGRDTLALVGAGLALDLPAMSGHRITDIESIDLRGSGDNLLRVSAFNVFDLDPEHVAGQSILRVTGHTGDRVELVGRGWAAVDRVDDDGVAYRRHVLGHAEVWVGDGVATDLLGNGIATITGITSGEVLEDEAPTVRGGLTVVDADIGDGALRPVAAGTPSVLGLGTVEVDAQGNWTYRLRNAHRDLDRLDDGETLIDSFVAISADGSAAQTVTITIHGLDERRVIDLAALDADSGFVVRGVGAGDEAGGSVASAGDVNGDGLADLVIGAPGGDDGGINAGEAYVVFGTVSGFGVPDGTGGRTVELERLPAGQGFVLKGDTPSDLTGSSVASAGDVNGDGFDDLVVGAPNGHPVANGNSGEAYVVFGSGSTFGRADASGRQVIDFTRLSAGEGFVVQGSVKGSFTGHAVAAAGDVNGDGFDDLMVAPGYVVFGSGDGFGTADAAGRKVIDIAALTGDVGFVVRANLSSPLTGLASAGDVNGDGFGDLVFGLPGVTNADGEQMGEALVLFGSGQGFGTPDASGRRVVDLSQLDAAHGFVVQGNRYSSAGQAVSSAGDVNGDGIDDFAVGAPFMRDADGVSVGGVLVVFGSRGGFGTPDASGRQVVTIDHLVAEHGFVVQGRENNLLGYGVAPAGDVNGDGLDDLLVGEALRGRERETNDRYVVFGSTDPIGTTDAFGRQVLDAGRLSASAGLVLEGLVLEQDSGNSLATAGDVDGDGFDDLIIGNPERFGTGGAGEARIVFGASFGASELPRELTGTSAADMLIGGLGPDALSGGGGADVMRSGAGNDLLTIADAAFMHLDAGTGQDRLVLAGGGITLDFTQPAAASVRGVETVDLTGYGANHLRLDADDVFDFSDVPNAAFTAAGSHNSLVIDGDADDTLTLGLGGANAGAAWARVASDVGLDGRAGGAYDLFALVDGDDVLAALAVGRDVLVDHGVLSV